MKLQPLLSEFLYTYGHLPLQGIGSLQVQQVAAQEDSTNQQLAAPTISIVFKQNKHEPIDEKLTELISRHLQIDTGQAQALLQNTDLKQAIAENGGRYSWPLVGTFSEAPDSSYLSFQPEAFSHLYFSAVPLKPILTVTPEPVATMERMGTAASLTEGLPELIKQQEEIMVKPGRWWVGAFIIFILSLLLIAYRYL